jgi:hypothetical protein
MCALVCACICSAYDEHDLIYLDANNTAPASARARRPSGRRGFACGGRRRRARSANGSRDRSAWSGPKVFREAAGCGIPSALPYGTLIYPIFIPRAVIARRSCRERVPARRERRVNRGAADERDELAPPQVEYRSAPFWIGRATRLYVRARSISRARCGNKTCVHRDSRLGARSIGPFRCPWAFRFGPVRRSRSR